MRWTMRAIWCTATEWTKNSSSAAACRISPSTDGDTDVVLVEFANGQHNQAAWALLLPEFLC